MQKPLIGELNCFEDMKPNNLAETKDSDLSLAITQFAFIITINAITITKHHSYY